MRYTIQKILGISIFALGGFSAPALAESGLNATSGAQMETGARIQSSPVTNGATVDELMNEDSAINDTGFELGTEPDVTDGSDASRPMMPLVFSDFDQNGDGQVSQSEFSTSVNADTSADSFTEVDKNQDGVLDENEFRAYSDAEVITETAK